MDNTEKVLLLLCKQIHLCTDVIVTLDDLNALKCNNATVDTVENFWTILNILSRHAVQKENSTVNFDIYGKVTATKLYFGYLNYSDIEFFALPKNNSKNLVLLLIAFSWLFVRHNVLNSFIKDKLINQIFDHEFIDKSHSLIKSQNDNSEIQSIQPSSDQINEFNVIIKKIMQINYNLKDITELINEKCCLLIKINRETSNIHNVPQLNLSELTLTKNYYTNNQKHCEADLQYIEKLNNAVNIINLCEKWSKDNHIFLKWMTNIVEECKSKNTIDIYNEELLKFMSTVHYLNKNKIYLLETSKIINSDMFNDIISSNYCQGFEKKLCTQKWRNKIATELTKAQTECSKKVKEIDSNMQILINSVPYCKPI